MKIGVLGGGQLARMLALAGYPLGIKVICVDEQLNSSASYVTDTLHAKFQLDEQIIAYFQGVNCLTYETENLPIDFITGLAQHYPVFPSVEILNVTQDRFYEKEFCKKLKIPTTDYAAINSWQELLDVIQQFGFPFVIKTRKGGYDGKGQYIVHNHKDAENTWQRMSKYPLIIEKFFPYDFEVSMITVRNKSGQVKFYPLTLNSHEKGILYRVEAPYVADDLTDKIQKICLLTMEKLNYVGVMTIEFFCLNGAVVVNEIAPRVHNSGHWTIEGAETSQFENHLRALLDLPIGSTATTGFTTMINCLGNEPKYIANWLKIPGLHFHTYEKKPAPNRKLGHITLWANNKEKLADNLNQMLNCES